MGNETIKTAEGLLMLLLDYTPDAEIDMSRQKDPRDTGYLIVATFSIHGRSSRACRFVSVIECRNAKVSPFEKAYADLAEECMEFISKQKGRVS